MKKKFLTMIMTVLLSSALLLTACGGNDGGSGSTAGETTTPTAEAEAIADTVESDLAGTHLNVAFWDINQRPGIETILEAFTAETGITTSTQVVPFGEYWTMLEATAAGGDMPDVMWMHSREIQRYMENGLLMDLTNMVANSDLIDMANYPEAMVNLYSYDGRIYAIPKDVDTIALWYNIDMFEEAGVELPNETWTWQQFHEAATALTNPDEGQWGIGWGPDMNSAGWWNIVYAFGGYIINEDMDHSGFRNPETIRAMEFLYDLVNDVLPPAAVVAENIPSALFRAGSTAMTTEGSWMVAGFRDQEFFQEANLGITLMPYDAVTGGRAAVFNGLGWAAAASTEHSEAAMLLVEWLGSEAMQIMQAELGISMSAFQGTSDAWINNTDLWELQPYLDMWEYRFMRPYSRNSTIWETRITEMLVPVWAGEADLHETLENIYAMMNEALEAERR